MGYVGAKPIGYIFKTWEMSRWIEFNGQKKNIVQWGEETGIDERQIHWRLKKGWSIEDALTRPVRKMPRRLPQSIRKQKRTMRELHKNKKRKNANRG